MSTERWERTKQILEEALRLVPEQRRAYLDSACEQDPGVRDDVESLIASYEDAGSQFLATPAPQILELASPNPPQPRLINKDIGNYRLREQIGRGGMGQVWLAEQTAPVKRQVALKLIKVGMYDDDVLKRFHLERQSLAIMDHPSIAKVFDAGSTIDGQPYFVMEYVPGMPITDYCDEKHLKIQERLGLFVQVCEAVQHAHQKAIIHRDLKPANILVQDLDGKPVPRIIDFGLAKAIGPHTSGASLNTQLGGFVGTPGYMSPEQWDGAAFDVDTRADVYSLGVVLYILLTGCLPFQEKPGAEQSFDEIVRLVRVTEPPRPSNKVIAYGAISTATAEVRGTDPKQLVSLLRGDLDTIVAKALKKDRQERYPSVGTFSDDLRRYLRHEPISARSDTLRYRAVKFVRRHRTGVLLTTTTLVLVIASLSTGLYIANRQRKIAQNRFDQVKRLANRFIDLDNELRSLPGSTKVRGRVVADSLQYLNALGNEVQGDNDLANDIARAYVRVAHVQGDPTSANLGQFDDAETSLGKAQKVVDSVLTSDPKNRRALLITTSIAHDRMVIDTYLGRTEGTLLWAHRTADLVDHFMSLGKMDPGETYAMGYFESNVAHSLGDRNLDDAIRAGQRALEIIEGVPSAQGLRGTILGALTFARWKSGDLNGALQISQRAIEEEEKGAGGHPSLNVNLANDFWRRGMILGMVDGEPSLGKSREALAAWQPGIDISEELAGKDPNDYISRYTLAVIAVQTGNILRHEDPRKALAVYDHALARLKEVKPNVSAKIVAAELLAGSTYPARWIGREKDANRRIEEAFQALREAHLYPADKVEPFEVEDYTLRAQADDYAETGQTDKAIAAYQNLLDKLMAWKPDVQNLLRDATGISRTWTALAELLRRAGRPVAAAQLETQRAELFAHWKAKLPNGEFLIRQSLRQISHHSSRPVVHCDHVEHDGESLFRLDCDNDLEGIVAKRKFDPYIEKQASWLNIVVLF